MPEFIQELDSKGSPTGSVVERNDRKLNNKEINERIENLKIDIQNMRQNREDIAITIAEKQAQIDKLKLLKIN